MLKSARNAKLAESIFHNDAQDTYQTLLDQEYSKSLAKNHNFGIAESLVETVWQLCKRNGRLMPSLFDIGKSGLQAYRQSLAVTGQNIANVNTKGYKKEMPH